MLFENLPLSEENIYKKYENCPYKIILKKEVTSTNILLKEMAKNGEASGTVLIAESQTDGKGRLGRRFESPEKSGLYMSVLLRPDINAQDALFITTSAAVGVARAIDKLSQRPRSAKIKWVNDIFLNDLKVCGILTESSVNLKTGKVEFAILGIGVNITTSEIISQKLSGIAGGIFQQSTEDLRNTLAVLILKELTMALDFSKREEILAEYRSRSYLDGKQVEVITPKSTYTATVLGIDERAGLIVQTESGEKITLSTGEVSCKVKK